MLPHKKYPFSVYENGFLSQKFFLEKIKQFKIERQPLNLLIIRENLSYNTQMYVILEEYTLKESANNGFDIYILLHFRQFNETKTTFINIIEESENEVVVVEYASRNADTSPMPNENIEYTVKKGDTLWAIAKYYYGDGSKYKIIADANKNTVSNPNKIYPNQILIIPNI